MNSKKPLYEIPVPSTSFDGPTELCGDFLRYGYSLNNVKYRAGIRFGGVAASRTRAERCCTAWHIDGVYDTLVVVEGSAWAAEIRADTQPMWRDKWDIWHYMIYLDGGCFELIAASWEPFQEVITSASL